MLARTLLAIANGLAFGVVIAIEFWNPAVGAYLFYGLLVWFLASLPLSRLPALNRRVAFRSAATASPADAPAPVASPEPAPRARPLPFGAAVSSEMFGFCIFCGTSLGFAARSCPACGRRTSALA